MQHFDPLIDCSPMQRKPGVGIKKPAIGMMPTIPGYVVVLWEGDLLHGKGKMFCYNPSCPCHESRLFIDRVARFVAEGFLTPDEATRFVAGKNI